MTLVIAHRGASAAEPENTIAAFERAREFGADGVELDVRRTADDRLVVHHDAALPDGRTIRSTQRAELPDSVPDLEEALDACAGMFVNIEIKNIRGEPDHDPSDWVAHHVVARLRRRPPSRRWLISSFRYRTVETCRRLTPDTPTAWLVEHPAADVIERAAHDGHAAIHPYVAHVTRDTIRDAHAVGLAVNCWTVDDETRIRELIGWGIDGICTNRPDVAVAARSAVG